MATATFTTVEARVDQTLTNAIYKDELQDNINQLAGAHRNLLVNGGFEVWQRGAGGFTANGAYTADRWMLNISGGTATVTQETGVVDGSGSALKIVTVGSVSQNVAQKLEDLTQLRGRTLACSVRVQQSVASAVTLKIFDGAGNSVSATSATTGSFVTLTTTKAIGAADAGPINVVIAFTAAGTFYMDNTMLVIGPDPAPYRPLHPQEELARCQRYYEVHGGVNTVFAMNGYNAAASGSAQYVPYAVPKCTTPTVTKNGTWGVVNCGQPAVLGTASTAGFSFQVTVTALGAFTVNANSTDDTIVSEANI